MDIFAKLSWRGKISNFFKSHYEKLIKIDDSPKKIALGFGLGVFMGIMPGVGPVAAVVLAILFRMNRVAAFIGGLLTNTWLSFIALVLAIKIGSAALGLDWEKVSQDFKLFLKDFHWQALFQTSFLNILAPLVIGYAILGLTAGALSYFIVLNILKRRTIRIKRT